MNPIFIVGSGHSGTSVVLKMLGKHSMVYTVNMDGSSYKETNVFKNKHGNDLKQQLLSWNEECLAKNKKRWVEKSPSHVHFIREILSLVPDCHIVGVVRDGRDVVSSFRSHYKDMTLLQASNRWIKSSKALLEAQANYPKKVKWVRYEDLVADSISFVQNILNFLDLPYEDLTKFHEDQWVVPEGENELFHKRYDQINQPIFDGRGRWKIEMTKEDLVEFTNLCKTTMIEMGYRK